MVKVIFEFDQGHYYTFEQIIYMRAMNAHVCSFWYIFDCSRYSRPTNFETSIATFKISGAFLHINYVNTRWYSIDGLSIDMCIVARSTVLSARQAMQKLISIAWLFRDGLAPKKCQFISQLTSSSQLLWFSAIFLQGCERGFPPVRGRRYIANVYSNMLTGSRPQCCFYTRSLPGCAHRLSPHHQTSMALSSVVNKFPVPCI